jgi:ubiquinone/menaquinone biosynthesis C-methylase UbiE
MIKSNNSAKVIKEYSSQAKEYDKRWQYYVSESIRHTLDFIELKPGSSLLDIGCGTGTLLSELSSQVPDAKLYGVDLSADMLAIADKKLPTSVELKLGQSDALNYRENKFDIIVSTSSIHAWPNRDLSMQNIARCLKPGGKLVVTDLCRDFISMKMFNLYMHISNRYAFRMLSRKDLFAAAINADLVDVKFSKYKISLLWGLMTMTAQKDG